MTDDEPDLRYTPFLAHYEGHGGERSVKHFATNAEAHEFRATLVDGKLPSEPVSHEDTGTSFDSGAVGHELQGRKPETTALADTAKAAVKAADKPQPPVLPGMVAKETPEPKVDANPPVPAAGRP